MRMAGLIGLFIVIAMFDLPTLIRDRRRKKKELIAYLAVMGLAFLLCFLHILGINVWSINRIITDVVQWVVPS